MTETVGGVHGWGRGVSPALLNVNVNQCVYMSMCMHLRQDNKIC